MTNKEALEECKSRLVCKYGVSAQTLSQDFWEICVEALEKQEADGCIGCKYETKDQYEMPCLVCKNNYQNMWKAGE